MILARHLSRAVLIRILAVAAGISGLAMALDLAESASHVLAQEDGSLLRYMGLRLPIILATVLPVACIVGSVLAFLTLAGRNEFTVLRAAGATTYRLLLLLTPLGLALGLCMYVLIDRVAPRMEATLITWLEADAKGAGSFWARTTTSVVHVGAAAPDGRLLADIDVYETTPNGLMVARIDARTARFDGGVWRFGEATRMKPGAAPEDISGAVWDTPLTPANIRALATPGRTVAGDVAGKVLTGDWAGNRSIDFYEVRVYRGYAALIMPLLMILLAAPATYGMRRARGFGSSAAWAVALGFGYLLSDGMLASLGESGNLPPALAAFGGSVLFAAIGGWALVMLEE